MTEEKVDGFGLGDDPKQTLATIIQTSCSQ